MLRPGLMPLLRRCGRLAALPVVLALLAVTAFGPGVMPARAADGSFTIVLCTDEGRVEVDAATLLAGQPASPRAKADPCAWAAAHAGPFLMPAGAFVAVSVVLPSPHYVAHPGPTWHVSPAPLPFAARGPPPTV